MKTLASQASAITAALTNVTVEVQKAAVWAVHKDRVHEGLYFIHKLQPALQLNEEGLHTLAYVTRALWSLDATREQRAQCYLCTRNLPHYPDALCSCLGESWEFDLCPDGWTHERLDYFIQQFGPRHVGLAYYCRNESCTYGELCKWTLNTIARRMKDSDPSRPWHPPRARLCKTCNHVTRNNRSSYPPRASSFPPKIREKQTLSIHEMAKTIGLDIAEI